MNIDKLQKISRNIQESIVSGTKVKIILFHENEQKEIAGHISKINTHYKKIKIEINDDFEWVKVDEIIDVILIY